jgi:hypothetical protein
MAAERKERFLDFDRRLCGRECCDVEAVSCRQYLVSALLPPLVCGQSEVDVALSFLQGAPLARVFSRVMAEVLLL